jgi:hypothetical protein
MLHRIGDVGITAIDAGFHQRFVEQGACRPDEWPALQVFFVARLFTHEHHASAPRAFAENGLRTAFPEIAGAAVLRRLTGGIQGAKEREQFRIWGRFR